MKCGEPLDRKGVHCVSCRKILNKESAETKRAYIECHICPRCRKNPIMGEEKQCPECRAKLQEWKSKRPEEKKLRDKESIRLSHERIRQERRDAGICYICGKREVEKGKKRCLVCKESSNRYNRERSNRKSNKLTREQKIEQGICIWCDQKAKDGKRLCEEHYDKSICNLTKGRKPNEQWRKENNAAFDNTVCNRW